MSFHQLCPENTLHVKASTDTTSSKQDSKDLSGTLSMTMYGGGSGMGATLGYGEGHQSSDSTTNTNSNLIVKRSVKIGIYFFKLCPLFRLLTKLYMPKIALRLTAKDKSLKCTYIKETDSFDCIRRKTGRHCTRKRTEKYIWDCKDK